MAAAEVVGHPRVVVGFLQEQQDGLGAVECEFAADATQQEVEEGVDEEPVLGLGGDHGDGVRAVRDELPGPLVGDVSQLGDHPADPVDDLRPDPGLPLITRDTVDFETPDCRATSSSVGRRTCERCVNTISVGASCACTLRKR